MSISPFCKDCGIRMKPHQPDPNICARGWTNWGVWHAFCCNCENERGWNNYNRKGCRHCKYRAWAKDVAAQAAEMPAAERSGGWRRDMYEEARAARLLMVEEEVRAVAAEKASAEKVCGQIP